MFVGLIYLVNMEQSKKIDDWQYLRSKNFDNTSERINQLIEVVDLPTKINDAEFVLFNIDGFNKSRMQIGLSAWDYRYAVKLDSNNIEKWLEGFSHIDGEPDIKWLKSYLSLNENWKLTSEYELYKNDSRESIILFRGEAIIIKNWVFK